MVFTEVQERGEKKYYYRVRSLRKKGKIVKERKYLGVNLSKEELAKKEQQADQELLVLNTTLTQKEVEELEQLRGKKDSHAYESFVSQFTYDSTNIEGNTFSLQETAQLLFEGVSPRKSLREINEITNHKEAFDYLLSYKGDINKKFILALHKRIVKNTLKKEFSEQAGVYRNIQVYIRGVTWLPVPPQEVAQEMQTLLSWYSKNKKKLHPLIVAAYVHSAFELIHPFVDGNGRVGRLLINFILHKNDFPMINIEHKKKYKYYEVLERAQVKGDLRSLVKFLYTQLINNKTRF